MGGSRTRIGSRGSVGRVCFGSRRGCRSRPGFRISRASRHGSRFAGGPDPWRAACGQHGPTWIARRGWRPWSISAALCRGLVSRPRRGRTTCTRAGRPRGSSRTTRGLISVPGADFESASCSASDARPQMVIQSTADKQYAPGRAATMTFTAPDEATIANFWLHRQLLSVQPGDNAPAGSAEAVLARAARPDPAGGRRCLRLGGHDPAWSHGAWWRVRRGLRHRATGWSCSAATPRTPGYPGDQKFVRFTVGCHTQPCALRTNGAGAVGAIFAAVFGATVTINDPTAPKVARGVPDRARGRRDLAGDESLTFDATDNSGIQKARARRRHAGSRSEGGREQGFRL